MSSPPQSDSDGNNDVERTGWSALAGLVDPNSSDSEAGEDHGFACFDEKEFGDFEDRVLELWEKQEVNEPTDPYKVLRVKPGDLPERVDASLASKLRTCGPGSAGVARLLKLRLRRARNLIEKLKKPRFREKHPHIGLRENLILEEKWAKIRYKNGYYEGSVVKKFQPDVHFGRHGKGITVIAGSEKYEGTYDHDMRDGIGIQFWKNGDVYVGQWKEDFMHGDGVYYYYTGAVYTGPFVSGLRHGRGRLNWSSGAFYIGHFDHDGRTGRGFLKQPARPRAQGFRYFGDWLEGDKHGEGRYLSDTEGYYKGQFFTDEFHGEGHLNLSNGNVYGGQFMHGRPQGQGSYQWGKSTNSYTGSFWRGRRDGKGEFIYQQPEERSTSYNGDWKLNEATGHGVVQMQNGDEYDGEVQDGKLQGHGTYKWTSSNVYEGTFDEGLRHGQGKLAFPNGDCYDGLFWEDLRHGRGNTTSKVCPDIPREEKWHFGRLTAPEHLVSPGMDDIQAWEDFMTSNGHPEILEAEQVTEQATVTEKQESEQAPSREVTTRSEKL